jgi:tellurite resistance protein/uncharacterized protein (DUF697 family)
VNEDAAQALVTIAAITAMADGSTDAQERSEIERVAERLGVSLSDVHVTDDASAAMEATRVARRFTTTEEREAAYRVALAVAHADGYVNTRETVFLRILAQALGVDARALDAEAGAVSRGMADAPFAADAATTGSGAAAAGASAAAPTGSVDEFILDQAMLTAALELLPDKLANLGIIPLQLRLVHTIGQRSGDHGESLHLKELMATLGLSVMAQALETAVRKTFGGLAGGLLGRMLGGAGGVAAGAAVTFASTYALGHVAQQYYAQGRTMSATDLKALFGRLKDDGGTMYPRVQERIAELARGNSLSSIMQLFRTTP